MQPSHAVKPGFNLPRPAIPHPLAPPADNLLSGFSLPQTRYYHDVSVDSLLHLSVVRAGAAIDMNLDCHRAGERAGAGNS